METCKGITKTGKKCKNYIYKGDKCFIHYSNFGTKSYSSTTLNFNLNIEKIKLFNELKNQGITSRTLNAMKQIPREKFIPQEFQHQSYENHPIPIGKGQTISQPYIVGYMIDILELKNNMNVLEIGTGSGYNLSILSKLAKHVTSIERIDFLYNKTKKLLSDIGINNITLILGDGTLGNKSNAPYDRIIVTAGATDKIPRPLLEQLKIGGILVIPSDDVLYKITKLTNNKYKKEKVTNVRFVPLIGEHGYKN